MCESERQMATCPACLGTGKVPEALAAAASRRAGTVEELRKGESDATRTQRVDARTANLRLRIEGLEREFRSMGGAVKRQDERVGVLGVQAKWFECELADLKRGKACLETTRALAARLDALEAPTSTTATEIYMRETEAGKKIESFGDRLSALEALQGDPEPEDPCGQCKNPLAMCSCTATNEVSAERESLDAFAGAAGRSLTWPYPPEPEEAAGGQ